MNETTKRGEGRGTLREIAKEFLRLGFVAYGGPAAHIAMMEERYVRRRGWLTRERFLDLLGAASLLPGPSSTEVAIYLGEIRGGAAGLIVAGACFILPAAVLVTALAWAYMKYGAMPQAGGGGTNRASNLEFGTNGVEECVVRRSDDCRDRIGDVGSFAVDRVDWHGSVVGADSRGKETGAG